MELKRLRTRRILHPLPLMIGSYWNEASPSAKPLCLSGASVPHDCCEIPAVSRRSNSSETIQRLSSEHAALSAKVSALEGSDHVNKNKIQALEGSDYVNSNKIQDLEVSDATKTNKIQALEEKNGTIEAKMEDLEEKEEDLRVDYELLKSVLIDVRRIDLMFLTSNMFISFYIA